jgi:hypothetical protein
VKVLVVVLGSSLTSSLLEEDINDDCDCRIPLQELQSLVALGDLTTARYEALRAVTAYPHCQSKIAQTYVTIFDKAYSQEGSYLRDVTRLSYSIASVRRNFAKHDELNCTTLKLRHHRSIDWTFHDLNQIWDNCCSILPQMTTKIASKNFMTMFDNVDKLLQLESCSCCCDFTPGSWSYLRLPALHEPAVRLRIPQQQQQQQQQKKNANNDNPKESGSDDMVLDLEQDGYLRLFDVATILWPSGYMLSLCLGNIWICNVPELSSIIGEFYHHQPRSSSSTRPFAIELGAGIGASSIAFSKSLEKLSPSTARNTRPLVVATDIAPYSIALTINNAIYNNITTIETVVVDHLNVTSVENMMNLFFPKQQQENLQPQDRQGFSLVFGSSLQGLFDDTSRSDSILWTVLDILLDRSNPNAIAIFVHTRGPDQLMEPSSSSFRLIRRISGSEEQFGNMMTRGGDTSDFEICVFRRNTILQDNINNAFYEEL